jgi:hypothetical protein
MGDYDGLIGIRIGIACDPLLLFIFSVRHPDFDILSIGSSERRQKPVHAIPRSRSFCGPALE